MKRFIENTGDRTYDLVIIGGGITGACVAYEAATRGFTVALVEKGDFGGATSAATSKMIHGGLRYLANGEFGIVRESLKERRILENIAPNYVYPVPFLLPLYKHTKASKPIMKTGMVLYDLLSYDKGYTWDSSKKIPLHRMLPAEKVLELEPVNKADDLDGGIIFYDCLNLIPERLTLAFIKSAVKCGAGVSNYARVEDFIREPGKIKGVVVRDLLNNKTVELRGKLTINCGGPWADLLLDIAGGKEAAQHVRRSEGIHLITRKLINKYCVGALTPSGGHCNIFPWRGHSLIGTTDKEYVGHPDDYRVTRKSIEEFISDVNAAFGKPGLIKYSDVTYAYGGLRPLVEDQTKNTYRTSRRYEIYDNEKDGLAGLIRVEGGKYTTSRGLAENVIRLVIKKAGKGYTSSVTAHRYLAGCDIRDINAFVAAAKSGTKNLAESAVDYLARLYGNELNGLMEIACGDAKLAAPLNDDGEMLGQAVYAIRNEMACALTDILIRRTGIGTLGHPGEKVLTDIADIAARELKWDQTRIERELEAANKALAVPK
jgi:glycerol-3-phosphate dehydrogenase